ncbi:DHA2 family efflux MFS transporter permease subunit [Gluconacetobacter aggeris]|uniref:DHA2 family efflux MFS transporter permease subunit n=1 Tax=Gluconacetobacter aggeris TaxID=1286186 RepID=A0A7W4NY02_9PROT|nr:DHA2 family efflux MFS transporter permease subunit [Gluconacetobacter aggeris]MBB2167130.1 DHA2 family efflux MFS transporter permease subunit [Gluconacetobacter aggeris]
MNATSASRPDDDRLDPQLLRIAAVVVLGTFMSILDTTIINVAVRDLSRDFGTSLATTQWISTGYMLALATVIPLTGWAADRYGTKRLYMASILLFLGGSALSGAAWSMPSLILFRVLQGLGGGMIMPTGMTILSHAAGPRRIGRLMGIIGVPMLLGPICGPILGGWLVDDVSWRWIFFVNLPVGVIALYAALRVLEPDEARPHHTLDWQGLLLLSPGLAIFVFGLARIAAAGNFSAPAGDIATATGLVLVTAFVFHAMRHPAPLIDVRMFGQRTIGASALTTFLFGTAFFGMSLVLPLYFQIVRQEPAFDAGLLLAAQGIGAMISMPLAARMTDRLGPGKVVLTGLGCVAAGMLALSRIESTTPFWVIEPVLFTIGLGLGSTMMPSMSAAMSTVQRHQIARTTSGLNVVQRVGGSIGTALLAVVLSHQISGISPVVAQGGLAAMSSLAPATQASLAASLNAAFGHTFLWSFGIVFLAVGPALFLPRRKSRIRPDEGAALSAME